MGLQQGQILVAPVLLGTQGKAFSKGSLLVDCKLEKHNNSLAADVAHSIGHACTHVTH